MQYVQSEDLCATDLIHCKVFEMSLLSFICEINLMHRMP